MKKKKKIKKRNQTKERSGGVNIKGWKGYAAELNSAECFKLKIMAKIKEEKLGINTKFKC